MYDGLDLRIEPGIAFEDVIRAAAETGLITDAAGNPEKWVRARLKRHRNPPGPMEQQRKDGRWFKISEWRMQDGGVAGVFTELTELKQREAQLGKLVEDLGHARDEANPATQAKSRVLDHRSTELRTAINPHL